MVYKRNACKLLEIVGLILLNSVKWFRSRTYLGSKDVMNLKLTANFARFMSLVDNLWFLCRRKKLGSTEVWWDLQFGASKCWSLNRLGNVVRRILGSESRYESRMRKVEVEQKGNSRCLRRTKKMLSIVIEKLLPNCGWLTNHLKGSENN